MAAGWFEFDESGPKNLLTRWRLVALMVFLIRTPSLYALSKAALIPHEIDGNSDGLTSENPLPLPPLASNDSSPSPWVAMDPDNERNEGYGRLAMRLANYDLPPTNLKS